MAQVLVCVEGGMPPYLYLQLHVLDLGPLLMRAASGGIALEKLHLMSWLFDSVIMH